ncbi:hypothetical protein SSX86_007793 [Deinandra increscens subsp. villosa]|uniref:Ubiquitin-like protease family profile domain-containing protein n=1 Tax=Deinandra increscens subsp. villosa TaxID=3103831 RepID=A0AAP0H5C2_9ASTR
MPTVDEASSDWFVSSARYINSEAKKNLTARTMNQAQTAEFKNDINLQQKYVNQFVSTNPEEENANSKYLQDCIDPFIEKSSKLFNEPGSSHENLNHIYSTPQQPQIDASRDPSSAQVNNSPEPSVQIIQKSERLGRGKRVKKKSRVMESPFVCHPVGGKQKYVWSREAADKLMNTEDLWHYSTVNPRFAFTDIFWSRLLGQSMDGWLTNEHILTWTRVLLERKPDDERWTILAPDLLDNVISNGSWNHKSAKPPYPNINDADLFYLPINIPGQHWFLVCIDIINWSKFIYDSLPGVYLDESNMRLTKLDNYFPQWLIKNKYRLLTTYRDPPFQRVMVPATRQSVRLGDCGVWVCINLERLTVGVDLIQEEDAGQAAMEWRENFAKHCYENTYRVLHEGSNEKRPKEVFPET